MERGWLLSVLAAAAVVTGPARADEAPGATPPPEPGTQAAQAAPAPAGTGETQAAAAPAGEKLAQAQPPAAPAAQPAEKAPAPPPPPRFTYGGSADFYYLSNFNDPFDGKNQLRAFDIKHEHGPHLGLVDLWANYARDPVGFRLDVDFGPTTQLVNAFEPSKSTFWEHVQQLYVSTNLDGHKGRTYVDFGKWVTTNGAEVIEAKDNWIYTRSLLFTWAIPFYHLGGRLYHYMNDTDYVGAAVHRGWNAVGYPHHDPGFALFGSKALNKQWTVVGNYYGGEETLSTGSPGTSWRNLVDVVLAYTPNTKWSHNINVDYGQQSSSKWYGIAGMSKYTLDSKSYIAVRGEWLRDTKGALFGTSEDVYEGTVSYVRSFTPYFQVRAEYRHDFNGGANLFLGDKPGKTRDNQGTVGIAAIFMYH